ncbi:response regulator [Alcanivorax sp. DP30]|uniref:response regulator n=1 Tax=Alcanivorax sp. DP30 TaxID=2606217 RepID=UPI001370492A|nr:response regulator [Alcanivorax sp. DP30]MZR63035.1 response regulator [Alcanivorax sp. DP30]
MRLQNRLQGVQWFLFSATVTALALAAAAYFVERQTLLAHQINAETHVHERLSIVQARLEGLLNESIQLTYGLVSVISANPDLTQAEFERAAHPLFQGRSLLRNIGAAPDMVIRYMYPVEGNEEAIGLDYRKLPQQRDAALRARDTGEMVLAGPLNLVQGGRGLVARIPVFIGQKGSSHFWGLLSVVLDADRLFEGSGLVDPSLPISVALRGKDGTGSKGEVFFGDPNLFREKSVTLPVTLAHGNWQLAAQPIGGWEAKDNTVAVIWVGFVAALLLCVGPMLLLAYYAHQRKKSELQVAAYYSELEAQVKARTAELSAAKEDAEAANVAKSAFLGKMSHELRTPLQTILSVEQLLRSDPLTNEQQTLLDTQHIASEHLFSVIADLIDLSKIEADKLELEHQHVDVKEILSEVIRLVETQAGEKGLVVRAESDSLPTNMLGDAGRLRQILLNYAGNAVKFTNAGEIHIRTWVDWQDADNVMLRFEVSDTGVGIPEEDLRRLFSPFEQATNLTGTARFGAGLGLAINKSLAQLMGGEAGAESEPGKGSTFWFTACLQLDATASKVVKSTKREEALKNLRAAHKGKRVLVAEDTLEIQMILRKILGQAGLEVTVVNDGREAIERFTQESFDLVLMDMQMPNVDGLTATREIRSMPAGKKPPILAITGNAFDADRSRCLAAGMNDVLVKPVRLERLCEAVAYWLSEASA